MASGSVKTVTMNASEMTVDFALQLSGQIQITVTASGKEQSTFDAFQAVTSLDSVSGSGIVSGSPKIDQSADQPFGWSA